jgi:hypothetical protein
VTETRPIPVDLRHPVEADLILTFRMAIQTLGRRSVHRTDRLDAEIMAEQIITALRRSNYIILRKPPTPIALASSLPPMGKGVRPDREAEPVGN